MANAAGNSASEGKVFGCFRFPLGNSSSSSSYNQNERQLHNTSRDIVSSNVHHKTISSSVFSVARSLIPTWRLLKLDPSNTLYFPYEPGKQVRSAIRIKNTSKSHVAFKFQTTAPKSCFMRPPGAILAPGESIITTVFRFFEHPESNQKPMEKKSRIKFMEKKSSIKFRIMSLKVQGVTDYVPELFDEHKHKVLVQQILRVVFLDIEHPSHALEKLNGLLAEADAAPAPAPEATKKPPVYVGPNTSGEGLIVDEWKERRERYLARQKSEGLDSV